MKKINSNIIYLLLLLFSLIALLIYKDFGISIDEKSNRMYGIVNLKYYLDFFKISYPSNFDFQNIENLNVYWDRFYGAFYEILNFIIIELIFQKKKISEIYYLRHLVNHAVFIFSLFFFYKSLLIIFKKNIYAFLGLLLLYTTPRIFADSFYNGKDLAFLSFFIIAFYFSIKLLENIKINYLIFFSFFSALSINLRFVSIYLPFLLIVFLILNQKSTIRKNILIIICPIFFYFLITPFLWIDPSSNILEVLKNNISFERMKTFYIFFLGEQTTLQLVSNYYLIIIFFCTTPLIIFIFGFVGFFQILLRIFKRLFKINDKCNQNVWKSKNEMLIVYSFSIFFIPIFFYYIFNSLIYNGWRHFYFLYPFFLIFTLHSINLTCTYFKNFHYVIKLFLIILPLSENIHSVLKFHPYQFAYFNPLIERQANKLFNIDYWGVSNTDAIKKIINLSKNKKDIYIANASYTDLNLSSQLLNFKIRNRIFFTGQDYRRADFIITNSIYEININYDNKYSIPSNFIEIYQIKKGNIIINKIYKKLL